MKKLMYVLIIAIIFICLLKYFWHKSKSTFCITIPSSPNNNCLISCDQISDYCYDKCNGNTDCIRQCYQDKGICYLQCLGSQRSDEEFCSKCN